MARGAACVARLDARAQRHQLRTRVDRRSRRGRASGRRPAPRGHRAAHVRTGEPVAWPPAPDRPVAAGERAPTRGRRATRNLTVTYPFCYIAFEMTVFEA